MKPRNGPANRCLLTSQTCAATGKPEKRRRAPWQSHHAAHTGYRAALPVGRAALQRN